MFNFEIKFTAYDEPQNESLGLSPVLPFSKLNKLFLLDTLTQKILFLDNENKLISRWTDRYLGLKGTCCRSAHAEAQADAAALKLQRAALQERLLEGAACMAGLEASLDTSNVARATLERRVTDLRPRPAGASSRLPGPPSTPRTPANGPTVRSQPSSSFFKIK